MEESVLLDSNEHAIVVLSMLHYNICFLLKLLVSSRIMEVSVSAHE
jgi:hypothetical protein